MEKYGVKNKRTCRFKCTAYQDPEYVTVTVTKTVDINEQASSDNDFLHRILAG